MEALAFNEKSLNTPCPVHSLAIYTLERDTMGAATAPRCGSGRTKGAWKKIFPAALSLPTTPIDFNERVLVLRYRRPHR